MHQVLGIAFRAGNKARNLKCVVRTAIRRVTLGVPHVYYHSAPQYTQNLKVGKYALGFLLLKGTRSASPAEAAVTLDQLPHKNRVQAN